MFHISALCKDAVEGKKLLSAAVNNLFPDPSISPMSISNEENGNLDVLQPTLLWHALYIQELSMVSPTPISAYIVCMVIYVLICRSLLLISHLFVVIA